jgi:uncharacterized membrane protein (UPF0127 family)
MRKFILFFVFILLAGCSDTEESERSVERVNRVLEYSSEVSFYSSNGERLISTVEVAVADDDLSRSEGLMDVHNLPSDSGMLFIFEGDQPRSFWMANTPLSLDILFANSEMEIVRIHRNTPPYSHEQIRSELPAKYVVEVNAGYTLRHDITEGMRISISNLE